MAREIRTRVRIWNFLDQALAERGIVSPEEVRSVELEEAVVDTGSTRLVLTNSLVQTLGLPTVNEITVKYADNQTARKPIVRGALIEIMDRTALFDAVVEEDRQLLIGMVVLEELDLWPDPQRGILTTNPASPDIPLYNLLKVS